MATIIRNGFPFAEKPGDVCYGLTPWTKGSATGFELAKFEASVRKSDGRLIWRKQPERIFKLRRSGKSAKFLAEVQACVVANELPYFEGLRHNDPAFITP